MRWSVVPFVLLLLILPSLPPVAAQTAASSPYVAIYDDSFEADFGWSQSSTIASNGWFRIADGKVNDLPRMTWYAARLDGTGAPGGYSNDPADADNDVDVGLTSPGITLPEGMQMRSIIVSLRGSSENNVDFLRVEWAPGSPDVANDWELLKTWTGSVATYQQQEYTSAKLRAHTGPLSVRFAFDSSSNCDSNPGDVPPGITPTGLPSTGTPPSANPQPNTNDPTSSDPGVQTGTPPSTSSTTPNPGFNAGETADRNCPPTGSGWFLDSLKVMARRDFIVAAGPAAPHITIDGADPVAARVDLIADMGKVLDFKIDESTLAGAPFSSMAVLLTRSGSTERFTLPLQKSGSVWSGLLAVDEPDLIAGQWTASFYGVASSGTRQTATRVVDIVAADLVPPTLTIGPQPEPGAPVRLGPGDVIEVNVQEPLLRSVTYSYAGLPNPLELVFPFYLPEAALPEGLSEVTITALDRAGHTTTEVVKVDRDTLQPALALSGPAVVYADVPFALNISILERSAHVLQVNASGTVLTVQVPAATLGDELNVRTTALEITPPAVGNFTVQVIATDLVGNQAVAVQQFAAVKPVTDLQVSAMRLASSPTGIVREGQSIVATVKQVGGVAPLPVTVVFEAGRVTHSVNVTVPATGSIDVRWNATLPAGAHNVVARAIAPAAANETAPGNEERFVTIEVFLGRITAGDDVYVIRADSRGLPAAAVLSGSSKSYPLTLVDSGAGIAYQFTIAGNRTLTWDPLVPVASVPDPQSTTPADDIKGAPFPSALMALIVVALAALVQRRRKA